MKVYNNIKEIRNELGLSLRDLSDRSGVSFSTIRKVELGLQIPNQFSILRIARSLNLPVCKVFDLDCNCNTCELCLTNDKRE